METEGDGMNDWRERARHLSNCAWDAVKEANGGETIIDNTTQTGKLSEMVLDMANHLGNAGETIDELFDENSRIKAELEEAKALLKPFASFTGRENDDDDPIDIIGEKGSCGNYCVPDSHGFEVTWADEANGQTVHFTAGQFRRVRAFFSKERNNG
jgi:hypothetical protein